ncbi:MAG: hypothetical protein U0228_25335 [Myxococcaceae bacterium]
MSDQLPPLGDELEALLGDSRGELAPAAAKAKARAALGLPPPPAAPAPHSPPHAPSAPPAPTAPVAPVAGGTAAATIIKGAVVIGLVGAAFFAGQRMGEERARDEYARLPPKEIRVEVPVPVPVQPPPSTPPVDVTPPPTTPEPPPVRPPPSTPKAEGDTLEAELALLEPARTALEQKDAAAALTAIARYDAKFARGSMRTEAGLIRLEALLLAGKRADAEALGKKLSSTTDSELVRARIKRLLDAP